MSRQLLNTESHGKTLYRALMGVITQMAAMDPRVDVGLWGCEVVEYPIGIKIGVHIVTHPKPTTTAQDMPILNVGHFDRSVLSTLFTDAVKKTFPEFKTYDVMFRISTLTHAGDLRAFQYIYANDAYKEHFSLNTSDISSEESEVIEVALPVTRIDQIRQEFKVSHYPTIRKMLLDKGYLTPEWHDVFVVPGKQAETYVIHILGYNPESTLRGRGSALINRNVRDLAVYREQIAEHYSDVYFSFELSLATYPAEILPAPNGRSTTQRLPAIPAPMDAFLSRLRCDIGPALFPFTQEGFDLYRGDNDRVWLLLTTTMQVEHGYPVILDDIPIIYYLLQLRNTVLSGRYALTIYVVSHLNTVCVMSWKLTRSYLQRTALRAIKKRLAAWIEDAPYDHPSLLTAVRTFHILAPHNQSVISEQHLIAFLDLIPGRTTPLDPAALFLSMKAFFTYADAPGNRLFDRVSKKQHHHYLAIVAAKERRALIESIRDHSRLGSVGEQWYVEHVSNTSLDMETCTLSKLRMIKRELLKAVAVNQFC